MHSYQPAAWLQLLTCGEGEDLCGIQLHTVVLSSWASFPGDRLNPRTFCKESTFPQKGMNVLCPQVSPVLWVYTPQRPAELSFPLSIGFLKIWLFRETTYLKNVVQQFQQGFNSRIKCFTGSKVILGKLIGTYLKCLLRNFIGREHFF